MTAVSSRWFEKCNEGWVFYRFLFFRSNCCSEGVPCNSCIKKSGYVVGFGLCLSPYRDMVFREGAGGRSFVWCSELFMLSLSGCGSCVSAWLSGMDMF